MVCAIFDQGGAVCGIQRVFLTPDGTAKAPMRKPKLTLGRIRGASLRLGPVQSSIIVCEGPEDGLSLLENLPGSSVWPCLGTGLMPAVEFPPEVKEITLAGQNDNAGRDAVERAGVALAERGYRVRTMFPDTRFNDFNDQHRGVSA
jgi:DNA primase